MGMVRCCGLLSACHLRGSQVLHISGCLALVGSGLLGWQKCKVLWKDGGGGCRTRMIGEIGTLEVEPFPE